jgi:uncharacterized protein (DUF433 family)
MSQKPSCKALHQSVPRVTAPAFHYIGQGVYSLSEAERLIHIPKKRIRRWLEGYSFTSSGKRHHSAPIVQSSVRREVGELALSFADLIEVRFLDRYRGIGLSWHSIRIAAESAKGLVGKSHPFSTKGFKTDGKHILAEIANASGEIELLNLVNRQWELKQVVSPMLYASLEFDEFDEAARWWPLSKRKTVVLDPARSFGAPITYEGGVRTSILAACARAEKSQRAAAAFFDVPVRAVRHAIEYEKLLAA